MLNTDGALDGSFGTGGQKTHDSGTLLILNTVDVGGDGKIVVGGTRTSGGTDIFIMRMDNTGAADTGFGSAGVLEPDLGANERVLDLVVQSDNSIIAVGGVGSPALIAKITNTGILDTGFASGSGYMSLDLDPVASVNVDTLRRVKVRSDGKIVAAGNTTDAQPASIVVQVNSNGTVDTTFSSDGITSHNFGSGGAKVYGLDLDTSNRILVTGYNNNGSTDDIFVARITTTGTKDTLFNSSGGKLFDYGAAESATVIKVRSDGSLVIAGADNLNLFPTAFFFIQKIKLVEP